MRGVGSPRQSTFTDNRTNFESGTLAPSALEFARGSLRCASAPLGGEDRVSKCSGLLAFCRRRGGVVHGRCNPSHWRELCAVCSVLRNLNRRLCVLIDKPRVSAARGSRSRRIRSFPCKPLGRLMRSVGGSRPKPTCPT